MREGTIGSGHQAGPAAAPHIRRLPSGMIIEACNDEARRAWDPLLIIEDLEREWRDERIRYHETTKS